MSSSSDKKGRTKGRRQLTVSDNKMASESKTDWVGFHFTMYGIIRKFANSVLSASGTNHKL